VSGGPSYDANGNQLSSTGLSSISWNAYGQAVSVSAIANEPYTGTYDAAGRLVEITLPSGGTQQFVYSPSGAKIAVVQQAQPGGPLVKGTVSLPGGDTAIYNFSGLSYLRHTDWLGSSRLATTWNHGVYSKESYAPFGETYNEQANTSGGPDRSFTGQDQDVVTGSQGTGIYEFMFRKYDPSAGRWLSPDPLGWGSASLENPQSLNRYAYVMNSPLSNVDPNGLECVWDDGSFDEEGDPETGTPGQCQGKGGVWIELGQNGNWSNQGNSQLSNAYDKIINGDWDQVAVLGPNGTYNVTSYNSIGLVLKTETNGWITTYNNINDPNAIPTIQGTEYNPAEIASDFLQVKNASQAQQYPDGNYQNVLFQDVGFMSEHPFGSDLHNSTCGYGVFMLASVGYAAAPGMGEAWGGLGYAAGGLGTPAMWANCGD
jgi:RHS repeat-associated protein